MTRGGAPHPVELDMRVVIRRVVVSITPASASPSPPVEREATGSLLAAARSAAGRTRSSA